MINLGGNFDGRKVGTHLPLPHEYFAEVRQIGSRPLRPDDGHTLSVNKWHDIA